MNRFQLFVLLTLTSFCAAHNGRITARSPDRKLALVDLHSTPDPSVEVLSWEGRVFLIRNLLNSTEADHLITLGKPALQRSSVVDSITGGSKVDMIRNSRGMFLPRLQDPVVRAMEERVASIVLLPVSHQEDPQASISIF